MGFQYDQKNHSTSKLVTQNEDKDDGADNIFIRLRVNTLIFSFDDVWVVNA